jgi:DNA-binding NtrC family response regulator
MNLSTKSILLVDDDQDDKHFFSKALHTVDDTVELSTACDGRDALEKLQFNIPDLILLDLNMPRMNGLMFLKEIKKQKKLKNIPVIIYTNFISLFDENEVLKYGAYGFYLKPSEYDKTIDVITEILQMNFIRMIA